ncbi:MAG: signal peptidase I [Oscillospiraceae bacterium]|nr:signal peptidase I [Oscillospiraceae bacterium]
MKIKNIFGIILNVLIVIVVAIVLIALVGTVQTKILKNKYSNYFGYSVFQVATGSMSPTMEEKDIIIAHILTDEQKGDLKVGDIIVFNQDGGIITHRITQILENGFITKGDANNVEDNPIQKQDIIGKVIKTIPQVGIWESVIMTPQVYISVLITVLLWGITLSYRTRD